MLDESKLSALLVQTEAMLSLQCAKCHRLSRSLVKLIPHSSMAVTVSDCIMTLRADIGSLISLSEALRDAGVQVVTEAPSGDLEPTSGDYGASGEEVADIYRALWCGAIDRIGRSAAICVLPAMHADCRHMSKDGVSW